MKFLLTLLTALLLAWPATAQPTASTTWKKDCETASSVSVLLPGAYACFDFGNSATANSPLLFPNCNSVTFDFDPDLTGSNFTARAYIRVCADPDADDDGVQAPFDTDEDTENCGLVLVYQGGSEVVDEPMSGDCGNAESDPDSSAGNNQRCAIYDAPGRRYYYVDITRNEAGTARDSVVPGAGDIARLKATCSNP